jgi:hypothetical protein
MSNADIKSKKNVHDSYSVHACPGPGMTDTMRSKYPISSSRQQMLQVLLKVTTVSEAIMQKQKFFVIAESKVCRQQMLQVLLKVTTVSEAIMQKQKFFVVAESKVC